MESLTLRIIIIDNASHDGTLDIVKEKFSRLVEIYENKINLGFTGGHNQGIALASRNGADLVCLINPDLILDVDCLENLASNIDYNRRIGASCPKIYRTTSDFNKDFSHIDAAGMYFTKEIRHLDRTEKIETTNINPINLFTNPEYVIGGSGACLMVSKECIRDASYPKGLLSEDESYFLDPDFFAYREDAELALRMQLFAIQTIYQPDAIAFHMRRVRPENRKSLPPEINSMSVRNRFLLQGNCISPILYFLTFPWSLIRNILVIISCFFNERTSIAGLKDIFILKNRTIKKRNWIKRKKFNSNLSLYNWFVPEYAFPPALIKSINKIEISKLCALIINYNQGDELLNCVQSILSAASDLNIEIYIVNNSPSDIHIPKLKNDLNIHNNQTIKILEPNENLGFSGAINYAAKHTNCSENDLFLILNPDVILQKNSIEEAINKFKEFSNLGALSPLLLDIDTKELQLKYYAKRFPRLITLFSELFLLHKIFKNNPIFNFQHYLDNSYLNSEREKKHGIFEVEQLAGACLFVRHSCFSLLNGFDEKLFPAWHEDVDFSHRLYKMKMVSAILFSANVLHRGGTSTNSISKPEFINIFYQNYLIYWKKHCNSKIKSICGCCLILLTFLTKRIYLVDFKGINNLKSIKSIFVCIIKDTVKIIKLAF